ncbi:MAG: tryptophan 7-halogenase [Planctomycetes bacterium]|nr:tryptophan 7-halogenase [Planctomycetota bacterium]
MTKTISCDLGIIGSGFGGSLLAIIARRLGFSVVLLERGTHPRFAIGESSTPLANFKLERIANRFDLDWLKPFAKYGPWKATHPQIQCGLKRGFSFFKHQRDQPFTPRLDNANALLVAASPEDARSDTHWFRADFDAHLVDQAVEAGVVYLDRIEIQSANRESPWRLQGLRSDEPVEIRAALVVDATGDGQLLGRALGLERVDSTQLLTRSRGLYSHFTGVARWHDLLGAASTAEHPFPCDAAALHQIIDGGWMWVLRFDHGITSAGFSLDPDLHPIRPDEAPDAEWERLLNTYPSLARQFRDAQAIRPMVRTGRLQRRFTRAAGSDWALLPHAAGFLDAWLSPGIAQTLFAVERLGRILAEDWHTPNRKRRLLEYGETVLRELAWMDEITSTCFRCLDRFEVMVSAAMIYFVAAIYCEERERAGEAPPDAAFLLADEPEYRRLAAEVCRRAPTVRAEDAANFATEFRHAFEAYIRCGLCDPGRRNLYPYPPGECAS